MTTNRDWLFSLPLEEQYAWMNAEHAESPTSATMQQIGQVIEDTVKRGVYGDTAAQDEDSREQLEADIEEWASIMDLEDQIDMIHGWLNRRAAILEREMVKFNRRYFDCVEQDKKIAELQAKVDELTQVAESKRLSFADRIRFVDRIDELTAERDELKAKLNYLKAHGVTISEPFCGGYEVYNEAIRERDELQVKVDAKDNCIENIMQTLHETQARTSNLADDLLTANRQREQYRKLFGMALDWAHEITMLESSIDEGMA